MSAVATKKPRDKLAGWRVTRRRDGQPYEYQLFVRGAGDLFLWLGQDGTWQLTTRLHQVSGAIKGKTLDRCKQQAITVVKRHLVAMLTEVTWTNIGSDNGRDDDC